MAKEPTLKYPTKIGYHNVFLERSRQDNDCKILIPGLIIRREALLKFPITTQIEIYITYLNLNAFKQKYC